MHLNKYLFFYLLVLSLIPFPSKATHYMGGEITWECLSSGKYRFIMKVYRECHGVVFGNSESLTTNAPGFPSGIVLNLYPNNTLGRTDISPDCHSNPLFPHLNCLPVPSGSNTGSVEEWVFTSDFSYPNGVTLSGVPPATGWYFAYPENARNPSTNLVGMQAFCLTTYMYPYNGQNANPCFDNSPRFAEKPPTVMVNGYKTTYNSNAYDPEGDSLYFEWSPPHSTINTPITAYQPGYSFSSPLPGITQNISNIPASIDPYTGQISYLSFTSGAFVTNFVAKAYKNGILVSKVQRELQVVLVNQTQFNAPPLFYPPFTFNPNDMFCDTVEAGDLVQFTLHASDFGLINDSSSPQIITYTASGAIFGTNYTSTTAGCLEPPCATLTPPPPFAALYNSYSDFSWQTECSHVSFGTGNLDNNVDYYFVFNFKDDFCAVPGFTMKTVKIVVKDPKLPAPQLTNLSVSPFSGDVTIQWTAVNDPHNVFKQYLIYYRTGLTLPWQFLDSVNLVNQNQYTHNGANGNSQTLWYMVKTRSGCLGNGISPISNLQLNPLAELYMDDGSLLQPDFQLFVASSAGEQHLICSSPASGQLVIQILDPSGRIVADLSVPVSAGNPYNSINLPRLTPGVYLFKGILNHDQKNGKFIVAR